MTAGVLSRDLDAIVTADPGGRGYGYADTQHPWHHAPAIDLPRSCWHEWLAQVQATVRPRTVVLLGGDDGGGMALALRCVATDVVAAADGDRPSLPCDVLLLDAGDGATTARWWRRHAGAVRPGGMVAIVDRSQDGAGGAGTGGVDAFVARCERDFLAPHGARWRRHGQASCVHAYVQSEALRAAALPALPVDASAAPRPRGRRAELRLWQHAGRWLAVPAQGPAPTDRSLARNRHDVVLVAAHEPALVALVDAWTEAAPELAAARQLLPGDADAARRQVQRVVGRQPGLGAALVGCVEAAPWCRELLLALGTLWLFGERPAAGAALLRRAARQGLDAGLVQQVAAAHLQVLQDEAGARAMLAEVRQEVRRRRVAEVCHALPRGHVLWDHPDVLAGVRGVLEVGGGAGGCIATWARLELREQCAIEGDPHRVAALQAAAAGVAFGRVVVVPRFVAGAAGRRRWWASPGGGGSLLPPHPRATAGVPAPAAGEVEVTTLDRLVAAGAIEPSRYDLLVVDAAGAELEVLQGAEALLRHVDVVVVTVWLQPVHDGAPLPQQLQTFLRELHGGDGFGLRAFEPGPDPCCGRALFRRLRPRS